MKSLNTMLIHASKLTASAFLITLISFSFTAWSQDIPGSSGKKLTRIHMVSEQDGKLTVFDTVFDDRFPFDKQAVLTLIDSLDGEMKDLAREIRSMRRTLIMGRADSLFSDSTFMAFDPSMIERFVENSDGPGRMKYRFRELPGPGPGSFGFPGNRGGDAGGFDLFVPDISRGIKTIARQGHTLNDILGPIPMDRVKSYSVKETRKGKRIKIELEKGTVIESRERVVVIRDNFPDSAKHYHKPRSRR